MVIVWLFVVGIGCLSLAGYFGWKYTTVPSKFDYVVYEKWVDSYRKKHPDAENDDTEKWLKEHPNGAPIDPPLKKTFMKRIAWGKRSIVIFGASGSILTAISSVF